MMELGLKVMMTGGTLVIPAYMVWLVVTEKPRWRPAAIAAVLPLTGCALAVVAGLLMIVWSA